MQVISPQWGEGSTGQKTEEAGVRPMRRALRLGPLFTRRPDHVTRRSDHFEQPHTLCDTPPAAVQRLF
jgi:hypothetical protein